MIGLHHKDNEMIDPAEVVEIALRRDQVRTLPFPPVNTRETSVIAVAALWREVRVLRAPARLI